MSTFVRRAIGIAVVVAVALLIWDYGLIGRGSGSFDVTVTLDSKAGSPVAKVSYVCVGNSNNAEFAIHRYPDPAFEFAPVDFAQPFEIPVGCSSEFSNFGRVLRYGQVEKFIVVLFEFDDGTRVFETAPLPTRRDKIHSITVATNGPT